MTVVTADRKGRPSQPRVSCCVSACYKKDADTARSFDSLLAIDPVVLFFNAVWAFDPKTKFDTAEPLGAREPLAPVRLLCRCQSHGFIRALSVKEVAKGIAGYSTIIFFFVVLGAVVGTAAEAVVAGSSCNWKGACVTPLNDEELVLGRYAMEACKMVTYTEIPSAGGGGGTTAVAANVVLASVRDFFYRQQQQKKRWGPR